MSPAEPNGNSYLGYRGKRFQRLIMSLLFGALLGGLIWLLSEPLTGHREPWDARESYYLGSLAIAGFIIGMATGRSFWLGVAGLYFGQLAYLVLGPQQHGMDRAPLWIGMLVLAAFTLVSLVIAAASVGVRCLIAQRPAPK